MLEHVIAADHDKVSWVVTAGSEARAVLNDPAASDDGLRPDSPDFWVLVRALREFLVSARQPQENEYTNKQTNGRSKEPTNTHTHQQILPNAHAEQGGRGRVPATGRHHPRHARHH